MASDVRQHWIELPRGARKTTDLAGIQLAALYVQVPPMARLYVGASDEDQAQELIDAALGLVERTPQLASGYVVLAYPEAALATATAPTRCGSSSSTRGLSPRPPTTGERETLEKGLGELGIMSWGEDHYPSAC